MVKRTPGWWLQATAVAHAAVGTVVYRDVLADLARHRLVGTVPNRGDRATAFWFLAAAPSLWLGGRLLRSAEEYGDASAQRAAGAVFATVGAVGSAAMPVSGFWALAVIGGGALRRGCRTARH